MLGIMLILMRAWPLASSPNIGLAEYDHKKSIRQKITGTYMEKRIPPSNLLEKETNRFIHPPLWTKMLRIKFGDEFITA